MMKTPHKTRLTPATLLRFGVLLAIVYALAAPVFAQTTPGGTQIQNQASATYTDGSGNNFGTVSNTVTVTVANVSGLAITPDAGTNPNVVPGQTNVDYIFTVTNTGNFSTQVRFLAGGQSVQLSGPVTMQAAVIDVNGNNSIDGADTDIRTNASDVLSSVVARNTSFRVIVRVNVNSAAAPGATVSVRLGDASGGAPTYDNQTANSSANEVRTSVPASTTAPANGESEARGDISSTVENDVLLRAVMNAPAGPVALGSNITYGLQLCNDGNRTANSVTLGAFTGVYIVMPIPVGTALAAGNSFPAGTLYTTSPLTTAPLSATWSNTAPGVLSSTTRVALPVGASLAASTCSASFNFIVSITTTDATNPIYAITDGLAQNSVNANMTDQSGDNLTNNGDGNASFNEPRFGVDAAVSGQGFQLPTLLQRVGSVLIGPQGQPTATGPTNQNDDYTNRSVSTGIAGVAPGGSTTAGGTVDFINTVRNTGNADDVFTFTAPSVPAGFTVQLSTNGGGSFTTLSGGGSTTLALAFGQQANVVVRVTIPAGQTVLTGFATVIRATSANTVASYNETIDRLYTGFLQLTKSYTIINGTGVGGPTDAVPGAVIEYSIRYENISSSGGDPNNGRLNISSLTVTEDGNAAPNNWGTTTDHVAGAATDTNGGSITGDVAGSTLLTDTVTNLGPGQFGTFKFRRTIK